MQKCQKIRFYNDNFNYSIFFFLKIIYCIFISLSFVLVCFLVFPTITPSGLSIGTILKTNLSRSSWAVLEFPIIRVMLDLNILQETVNVISSNPPIVAFKDDGFRNIERI